MKILHIGNIANNAYLNASILNKAGLSSQVLCADYYHIMGCPQWEEGTALLDYGSTPESLRLHAKQTGAETPVWFVQGPLMCCLLYLAYPAGTFWHNVAGKALKEDHACRTEGTHARKWWDCIKSQFLQYLIKFFLGLGTYCKLEQFSVLREKIVKAWAARQWLRIVKCTAGFVVRFSFSCFNVLLSKLFHRSSNKWRGSEVLRFGEELGLPNPEHQYFVSPQQKIDYLLEKIFKQYDVIIGYGLDGIFPWITKNAYCAYEHGTIRAIPFENNMQGKCCAAVYKAADHVFITNCDNITAANRLGLKHYSFIPHPINEAIPTWIDPQRLRQRLNEISSAEFWIFHPSRQHWNAERHPSWEKGNDRLIRGLAKAIHEKGISINAIFVDWGAHVEDSKKLIHDLGIEKHVVWVAPMPHPMMVEYIMATDFLADQFHLGAFGSTAPKGLMLKKPVLIYLDEDRHRWCFPEIPPFVNVKESDEIASALDMLCSSAQTRLDIATKGREWYVKYHSNEIILDHFREVFRSLSASNKDSALGA